MEYTVKQSKTVPSGATDTNKWWQVVDPLGNVITGAQYRYMAARIANDANANTKAIRAEIARLQAENAKLVAGIKSLIEAQNRGIAANEPFNDAFYKGRVDSMWHTVKALETILAESEADNA